MGTLKTLANDDSVTDFIASLGDDTKRQDSRALVDVFAAATGQPAKMWGTSIVGFGSYHYKSERSSQEGDWPLVAFSPRKQNLTLYSILTLDDSDELLAKLGKHKTGKGCLYINKLADIDMQVLEEIIKKSYRALKAQHGQ